MQYWQICAPRIAAPRISIDVIIGSAVAATHDPHGPRQDRTFGVRVPVHNYVRVRAVGRVGGGDQVASLQPNIL